MLIVAGLMHVLLVAEKNIKGVFFFYITYH